MGDTIVGKNQYKSPLNNYRIHWQSTQTPNYLTHNYLPKSKDMLPCSTAFIKC